MQVEMEYSQIGDVETGIEAKHSISGIDAEWHHLGFS
jgi:hypothetical protein